MKLITYKADGLLGYSVTDNIIDWLIEVNKYPDAPYFILNVIDITEGEFNRIKDN